MALRKAGGEMYPWADWTWNPLGGACPHDCAYCYMKSPPMCWSKKYRGPQRIIEKEMKVNLDLSGLALNRREVIPFVGDAPLIFVCSGNELSKAPTIIKQRILRKCQEGPRNYYLLQDKDPAGLKEVEDEFPPNVIIGTTTETNRADLCRAVSNAPSPRARVKGMKMYNGYHKMDSIEPMMDFDSGPFAELIQEIAPDFVSMGADSKKHNLPEPSTEKVLDLVSRLKKFTIVKKKENLGRLLLNRDTRGRV